MNVNIPELSLVVLIGASGSGKSTFAAKHFKPTEVVSSDTCRGLVSDDENNQLVSADAFELVRFIAAKRLKNGLLTVIDATNVQEEARRDWIALAREYHCLPVALVCNLPEKVCFERNDLRTDRRFGKHVIPQQVSQLRRNIRNLKREGFRHILELRSIEEMDAIESIIRTPLYNNKKSEKGPFDIIGDIHGCYDELLLLLTELGYGKQEGSSALWQHPAGRKLIFLGDLVDRGPKTPEVLKLVMDTVKGGAGFCVPGNHDAKLLKWLNGKDVQIKFGLDKTIEQLGQYDHTFRTEVRSFIDGLITHYVFDEGNLVVSHAGIREEMQGRGSAAVRDFCLFGETTGETDEFGLPVRYSWASDYKGKALVVYGHTPVADAQWFNRTINIDTGCVFGGKLTALRYPEKELVSVPSLATYAEPLKPLNFKVTEFTLQQEHDDLLDIADVSGKKIIQTKYGHNITIREENSMAALEVMSRFAINPKWLIYLPPTMSPSETSDKPGLLEHPAEAVSYYQRAGVEKIICEEKHMGSRAILIVGRDEKTIRDTFGISREGIGTVYTRTGRPYFNNKSTEQEFLERVRHALVQSGFFDAYHTNWVCLDGELMPWSAKAQALLQSQYAAVGTAAQHALHEVTSLLKNSHHKREQLQPLLQSYSSKQMQVDGYVSAYRNYCWPVNHLEDYKLAPFHIMATEGQTYFDKSHEWHLTEIKKVCDADPSMLLATQYRTVQLHEQESIDALILWWESLTSSGGEGMVVKPQDFIATNKRGLIQPAIKIRGKEYLRIIYGPEYTSEANITRLKARGLSGKRSLALREFALGVEGLQRFINKEPLRRVHECVFGVLALESEPVDPRL